MSYIILILIILISLLYVYTNSTKNYNKYSKLINYVYKNPNTEKSRVMHQYIHDCKKDNPYVIKELFKYKKIVRNDKKYCQNDSDHNNEDLKRTNCHKLSNDYDYPEPTAHLGSDIIQNNGSGISDDFDSHCKREYGREYGLKQFDPSDCSTNYVRGICSTNYYNGYPITQYNATECVDNETDMSNKCLSKFGQHNNNPDVGGYGCMPTQKRAICKNSSILRTCINCASQNYDLKDMNNQSYQDAMKKCKYNNNLNINCKRRMKKYCKTISDKKNKLCKKIESDTNILNELININKL